ncbi:MAG: hypothetical protein ACLS69_06000, partial [Butyricicoccus sp.]
SVYYEPQHAPMSRSTMNHSKRLSAGRVDPEDCAEYRKYRQMGEEICQRLNEACRQKQPISTVPEGDTVTNEAEQVTSAAERWTCPACGGANTGRFCEYCGSLRP